MTFNLVTSLLLLLLVLSIFSLFYWRQRANQIASYTTTNDNLNRITSLDWKVKALIISASILVLVSFLSPFLFTRSAINKEFDFSRTGEVGSTIGGLMGPFIALSGVVVTGLAFYIQYKANLLQREMFLREQAANKNQLQIQIDNQNLQLRLQQFESQFYEMLRLHRENISEMKINGYDFEETGELMRKFEKTIEGRKAFVVMKTEFETILSLYVKDNKLDKVGFKKCYSLFFSGLERYEKNHPADTLFTQILKKARERHENPNKEGIKTNQKRKEFLPYAKLYFNYKPFSGHSQTLGHYFRHLYLAVKSIATSNVVTDYEERMKYLRILRAQLSNHEQILLFYNWLSEYGAGWENDCHSFFTEYCMIHNLWYDNLFDNKFITDNVNYLRNKDVKFRKGDMFEIDG